jgi:nitrite reductase (NADH) small subunit
MSKWIEVGSIDDIPVLGARVVNYGEKKIAVFRNKQDEIFAINDQCPHRKGFLSQGIVHNKTVTCPMHNWKINLESGEALAPDEGCTGHYAVKMDGKLISIEV